MPGENRRGPRGEGPRTGRGLGRCNDSTDNGKSDDQQDAPRPQDAMREFGPGLGWRRGNGPGRGLGRGLGRGRGFGRGNR